MSNIHSSPPDPSMFWKLAGIVLGSNVVVAIISFFSSRPSGQAATQAQLNATATFLIEEIRKERDDCHERLAKHQITIEKLQGDLAQSQQVVNSLINYLRRNGMDVPTFPLVETVFVLDSSLKEETDG